MAAFIMESVDNLIAEKCLTIKSAFNSETEQLDFDITFTQPEWYKSLESDVRSTIYESLKKKTEKQIQDISRQHNKDLAIEKKKEKRATKNAFLSDEDYKQQVATHMKRLLEENAMSVVSDRVDGKLYLTVQFIEPEWYKRLDDVMKSNVFTNLQTYYRDVRVPQALAEMNKSGQVVS
jgi:hypothetical protein